MNIFTRVRQARKYGHHLSAVALAKKVGDYYPPVSLWKAHLKNLPLGLLIII
jgi:hypothetical protein